MTAPEPVADEADERLRCHCWWRGERCQNRATAEDLLCNWCTRGWRAEEVLRADPTALIGPDDEYLGIGGGGQLHDSRLGAPGACWYVESGRTVGRG